MSFLTLEKYLYSAKRDRVGDPAAEPVPTSGFFDLSLQMMESVNRSVLAGEAVADLAGELDAIRAGLRPDAEATVMASAAERFGTVLSMFRDRVGKADAERAADVRNVLSILTEAFSHVSSRNERSDTKFKYLEESLQVISRLDDLRSVKNHLSEVLRFVSVEAAHERQTGRGAAEALGKQINQLQRSVSRLRPNMAGRDQAIAAMNASLAQPAASTLYGALFVADAVDAIRSRHGAEVADSLMNELGCKELQALVPAAQLFCWSRNTILLLWQGDAEHEYAREFGPKLSAPFEYRTFVGNRMANFSVGLRSAVMRLEGSVKEIVWSFDLFVRGGA